MTILLLAAGAVLCASGLLAVGFGIPIKEFSFGNTMILAGVTLLSSGFIVVALAVVSGELRKLIETLDPRKAGQAAQAGRRKPTAPGAFPGYPAPAAGAGAADDQISPSPAWPTEGAAISGEAAGQATSGVAASRPSFLPEPVTQPKLSFEAAWPSPKAGGGPAPASGGTASAPPLPSFDSAAEATPAPAAAPRRSDLFRRSARASSLAENPPADAAHAAPAAAPPPPPAAPATPVSILKSGVVDGMAYTLYSDGSIETEMAEGKVRFASIEALRTHLDQRGT